MKKRNFFIKVIKIYRLLNVITETNKTADKINTSKSKFFLKKFSQNYLCSNVLEKLILTKKVLDNS